MTIRRTKLLPEEYELGSLWLYREDLQSIATAIGELGPLKITCTNDSETYSASEPSDFAELPEQLTKVVISSRHGDGSAAVTVTLGESASVAELLEPNTHAAGVLSRIEAICRPRRRKGWQFLHRGGIPLAIVAFVMIIIATNIYGHTEKDAAWHNQWLYTGLPSFLVALIFVGGGMRFLGRSSRRVVITNATQATHPRYWDRTRDIWVVGVITAVIGAIIGYLLGLLS